MTVVINGCVFVGTPEECWQLVQVANGYTSFTPTCEQLQDNSRVESSKIPTKNYNINDYTQDSLYTGNRNTDMFAYYRGEKIDDMSEERLREVAGILHLDKVYDIDTIDINELKSVIRNAAILGTYDKIA